MGCLLAATIATLVSTAHAIVLPEESEETTASYARLPEGHTTDSGEKYDSTKMSASHPSLPFGTVLRIQNQETGESIDAKVNHRCQKDLQLSFMAAKELGLTSDSQKLSVLATPVGMTTAQIEPQHRYQKDAIMVAFGANDYDPSAFTPEEQAAMERSRAEAEQRSAQMARIGAAQRAATGGAAYPELTFGNTINASASYTSSETTTTLASTTASAGASPRKLDIRPYQGSTNDPGRIRYSGAELPSPQSATPRMPSPLRAQFGAYNSAQHADLVSRELNQIGFETVVMPVGSLHCVVTRGTFPDSDTARRWASDVRTNHHRDLTVVRL